jgi:hypothetical protein
MAVAIALIRLRSVGAGSIDFLEISFCGIEIEVFARGPRP